MQKRLVEFTLFVSYVFHSAGINVTTNVTFEIIAKRHLECLDAVQKVSHPSSQLRVPQEVFERQSHK